MQYVVIDLEWNGSYSKKAHGYFNEIIEIGAVKLDEDMQIVDTWRAAIRPVVSKKLSDIVTDLTNITPEELEDGTTFSSMVSQFRRFAGQEPTAVLTWSTTDLVVLMENCRYFFGSDQLPVMRYYMDLQAYTQRRLELTGGQQLGLSKAGELLSVPAEDISLHRALDDSLLSAKILQQIYEPESFKASLLSVNSEFYRRLTFKTTIISDLNDPLVKKSDLRFSCPECGRNLRVSRKWRFFSRAFCAQLSCSHCGKQYTARVQFRLKYDGMECRKKLTEKIPKPEETVDV